MLETQWNIKHRDVARVKKIYKDQVNSQRVKARKKNLAKNKPCVREVVFWHAMVMTRVTTLENIGPGSRVEKLENECPFPLDYATVRAKRKVDQYIDRTVAKRKFWLHKNIGKDLATNLCCLEKKGRWKLTLEHCNHLTGPSLPTKDEERIVARYIAETFRGFGPKQSRNLLQTLGLTRYEIPIDSRVSQWVNENLSFPVCLTPPFLANPKRYEWVLSHIQSVCQKADISPCLFDAAVLSELEDKEGHTSCR